MQKLDNWTPKRRRKDRTGHGSIAGTVFISVDMPSRTHTRGCLPPVEVVVVYFGLFFRANEVKKPPSRLFVEVVEVREKTLALSLCKVGKVGTLFSYR